MRELQITLFILSLICLEYSLGFGAGMDSGMDMGVGFSRRIRDPLPYPPQQQIKEEWFTQYLDHKNKTDKRTWKQRYFRNQQFYMEARSKNITSMPVFVMIGGEGKASAGWLQGGYWIGPAAKHGALLLQLEHRFYGKSRPTEDMSLSNLKYLTSEQALTDLVYFIVSVKKAYNMTDANKVVCFGGSYPGDLAAWVRLLYPKIVHGSVSSSGPVEAEVDFSQYFDVVMESMKTISSEKCPNTVRQAVAQLKEMVKTQEGCNNITQLFGLCTPLYANNDLDIQMFFNGQGQRMAGVVQYNKPPTPGPKSPDDFQVVDMCKILEDESVKDPMQRFINLNNKFKDVCVPFQYKSYIYSLRQTAWSSDYKKSGRQWVWQTCNEFGFFQTSNREDALLNDTVPVTLYTQTCRDAYFEGFTDEAIQDWVDYTNKLYKGKDIVNSATNICYVQGTIDPWSALGVDAQNGAIVIRGTSHCADMNTPSVFDIPTLKEARRKITAFLDKLLS